MPKIILKWLVVWMGWHGFRLLDRAWFIELYKVSFFNLNRIYSYGIFLEILISITKKVISHISKYVNLKKILLFLLQFLQYEYYFKVGLMIWNKWTYFKCFLSHKMNNTLRGHFIRKSNFHVFGTFQQILRF